jgi:hypothetical protein
MAFLPRKADRRSPPLSPPLTIIESPYAGDIERNTAYARECLADSIRRGEVAFASHLFYPQVLSEETERDKGIELGYAFWPYAEVIAFYVDLGWSRGMLNARRRAVRLEKDIAIRRLTDADI